MLTRDHTDLPATHTFIYECNQPFCLYSTTVEHHRTSPGRLSLLPSAVWSMSECIWGALRKNALYKSTYTLLYFTLAGTHFPSRYRQGAELAWVAGAVIRHFLTPQLVRNAARYSVHYMHALSSPFWSDQEVLYNDKADLHGIGNCSIIHYNKG